MAFIALSRLVAKRNILGMKHAYLMPRQISPALTKTCTTASNHDDRNKALGRPLSPHLSIYKFEITMALSIMHRITGCVLGAYATGWAGVAVFMPHDITHYISLIETMHLGAPVIIMGKFVLGFPFVYHTLNGIRHLTWDTASFVSNKGVLSTGIPMCLAVLATMGAVLFM